MQSSKDYVAKPVSAYEIYEGISSKNKIIKWYDKTSHFVPNEMTICDVVKDSMMWLNLRTI